MLGAALLSALLPVTAAHAAPDKNADPPGSPAEVASAEPAAVTPEKRTEVLGKGWQNSPDVAWTTTGDSDGLHVLVASAKEGYTWRTLTTLSEPGFDVDQWIGNTCVTSSGKRLVVVYAPRTFTNKPDLFERGGYTATVDLESGAVTKVPIQTTLAYYNPGCGAGESAILTQAGSESLGRTRLVELDAAKGSLGRRIEVPGQLTSAIPTKDGIVAADNGAVVTVDEKGARRVLSKASATPFHLKADGDGGVVFLDREGETSFVRRVGKVAKSAQQADTLARGPLTELSLAGTAAGKVVITGKTDEVKPLPAGVSKMDVPKDSEVSTTGQIAITSVLRAKAADPRIADPRGPRTVRIEAEVATTGKRTAFTVDPAGEISTSGRVTHPKLASTGDGELRAAGDPSSPLDPEQVCAIPRNDPKTQVYQPTPRQVEWAVNYAVTNGLHIQRAADWKQAGMPSAWKPQEMFPPIPLDGGGRVPSQVLLGILAQESNLWQAARFALPGETANPLIGNFYGVNIYNRDQGDDWDINWAKADCGYGVTQITDGMRLAGRTKPGETALPADKQRAVAVDFATNIAAGLQILQKKWNQTRQAGLFVNDGNPKWLENWFFAVWAYNSGFYTQNSGPWGLGWLNNPANPHYPPNRAPFLETSYADAAHPGDWSYPEKVMGWAGHPIESVVSPGKLVSGYAYTWWGGWDETRDAPIPGKPSAQQNRRNVKPPTYLFCEPSKNDCDRNAKVTPNQPDDPNTPEDESTIGEPAGPCTHRNEQGYYDLRCWWHYPATWKSDCAYECGNELIRFREPDVGYQPDGISYPPNCSRAGLPAEALIVDDVPTTVRPVTSEPRPCPVMWQSNGSFALNFASDAQGRYPSKIDYHQMGAGFGGHFTFAHTWKADPNLKVTGTWTLDRPLNGWARVLVHTPDHGAHTQQARYQINRGNGSFDKSRYISQGTEANKWVSLGVYQFNGTPQIRLDNQTLEGRGVEDIAWDAVAFQPLPAKPRHLVAVLGDSFSSGEGGGEYYRESDNNHGKSTWAACRRSPHAWGRKVVLPAGSDSLGKLADEFSTEAELGFVACSGARTGNVRGTITPGSWTTPTRYDWGEGQFREIGQIDSGAVDENTTLVLLTIGGNDEGMFAGAITECAMPPGCAWNSAEFIAKYKAKADRTRSAIESTLLALARKAPNAKVVLLSYPRLFNETPESICTWQLLGDVEGRNLNTLGDHLTQVQRDAVASVAGTAAGKNVYFAPVTDAFNSHRVCDDPPWINEAIFGPHGQGDYHEGDIPVEGSCLPRPEAPDLCLSRETFHPNQMGTTGYAQVLQQKLLQIGYQGS
ncbi:SGNH/GDSL hydrolase family protein [Lentzea xinjiangensis]|uniref:SGNH/GDSL hydrolase family protein n=1 Tax=Lentzea xinjiangensis TaxID=402600 RepID=UPI001C43287C|nr:SGNH/GDSL hydrolase family protein [Lentzea xinjiangensis]